jgi:hypothetical protein
MKIYKPTKWSIVTSLLVLTGIGIILFALNNATDIKPVLVMAGMFGTIDLVAYLGTNGLSRIMISADQQLISRVGWTTDFKLDISSITRITKGTHYFPVAQTVVSIHSRPENGSGERNVMIRTSIWTDEVLGKMIKDLRKINSTIALDEYTEILVQAAK